MQKNLFFVLFPSVKRFTAGKNGELYGDDTKMWTLICSIGM
jgi:hypothetical protein